MSMYGKMAKLVGDTGMSVAERRGRASTFYASAPGGAAKAIGATIGGVPAAAHWAAIGAGVGPFQGMTNIGFSVGGAKEHSGAAYGISTHSSGLTEKTLHYGQEDLRGTSRYTSRGGNKDPLRPSDQSGAIQKDEYGTLSSPWKSPAADVWNPPGIDQENVHRQNLSPTVLRGYSQTPPPALFQPSNEGPPARPLFSNPEEVDTPYHAPRNMGGGPRTTRRQAQVTHEQVLDNNLTQNGQPSLFD